MKLVLVAGRGRSAEIESIARSAPGRIGPLSRLAHCSHTAIETSIASEKAEEARSLVADRAGRADVDWALMSSVNRRKKLLMCDMDSTLILEESLDELAALAGCGEAVAEITDRAMREGGDFASAFRARLALLRGVGRRSIIAARDRLRLTPGASEMVATMQANGARCILVSGGLDIFVSHISSRCRFDAWDANSAIFSGDVLTGGIAAPIKGASAKSDILRRESANLRLDHGDSLAIGDGDNDRDMVAAAGLGIAYHGSDVLRRLADCRIDHTDLTSVLYFQGYGEGDIVRPTEQA